jgi:chromosome segregation ATPase
MFSLLEDQFIDDAVTRAEQSRVSYNTQTEEFRNLNANLQSYLGDIKTIDENNHQLQKNIEEIRTNYISTLENHLKLLPNDFREKSQKLTEGHIERYRIKSRTRRTNNEREELKRRINFIASNEKEHKKRLTILQKQEREVRNEFNKLNEQVQNLLKFVESEKQIHRQAMDKVDSLQIQHEQICFERSKTEVKSVKKLI